MKKYTFSFIGRQVSAIGIFYEISDSYTANNLGEALYMLYTDYEHMRGMTTKEDGKEIPTDTVRSTALIPTDYKMNWKSRK